MNKTKVTKAGAFQTARKIFESELWLEKPATWKVIWIYIIGNVNHTATKKFERGEGHFVFKRELQLIGKDITEDMVKKFLRWALDNSMISTSRSTRGTRVKVLNYNKYQTLDNYRSTYLSTSQTDFEHLRSTPIHKNDKNDNKNKYNEHFKMFWEAYPKKKNKGQAEKTFKKYNMTEELLGIILKDIKSKQMSKDWLKEDGQYIPYPATYLNARAWEDEERSDTLEEEDKKLRQKYGRL